MKKRNPKSRLDLAGQAERIEADLSAVRRALRRPLESEFERGQLTPPQTAVMRVIVRQSGISLRDLSREVSLAHSTVSGIVDRLEKRGLVERRPDPDDGRFARIHPTTVVKRFIRQEMPALVRGPLQEALSAATPQERIEIENAVRRLRELLETPLLRVT
jgi:DNA-binding MarR family transcriptional regulator